ncbi:hypothetical protein EDM29_15570, partial [Staphylococcus aureus]
VENAAYPSCICAERSSLVAAISEGYRPGEFESITITVDADKPSSPCGTCRQVLKELCDDDMPVYMTNHTGELLESTVAELLPYGFSGKDLVENAAYPSCICAERSSLVAAISEGYRPGEFESI